ncbi:MAG: MotA/TolQ/ExbB proton channel family protein [Rhodospirillales bacterium]|nr:MotA/TolQ/ExbB proton channel family protein [Rhodospirillales bacterium]
MALIAPVAVAGSAWAQDAAAPAAPATAPAATPAPAAATPDAAAPAAANSMAPAAPVAAENEPKQLAKDMSVTGMVKGATGPVQVVMILLAIASVWSWAIMLDKAFTFAGLNRRADSFLGVFRGSSSLDDVYQKVAKEKNNPLVNIFLAGMNELRVSLEPGSVPSDHLREHIEERVTTSMEMVEGRESERLGSGMGVLATVGSTSPFIGLFGTVYGIMDSFLGIANSGTTNLAVVAPGIAEALLTTAIGLAAAIPAVIMYNYFARKVGAYNGRMNNFVGEFSTVLSRHLDRKV